MHAVDERAVQPGGLLSVPGAAGGGPVSFLTIGIIWVNHHAMFALVRRVDRPLLFLNLLLLLVISVIPFPTAVVGQVITDPQDAPVAAALLGVVFLVMGLAFGAIWLYAVRHHATSSLLRT
jgi:uncharacterized membrane protein